jgi:sulfiredoxin
VSFPNCYTRARPQCPRRRHKSLFTLMSQPDKSIEAENTVESAAHKYNWGDYKRPQADYDGDDRVMEVPIAIIRRPHHYLRANDQEKIRVLMESIEEIGQVEPIDVLEVDGAYYNFNGCHRFEACMKLGKETIKCKVRKATLQVLKMHMM